jgi:protocatechuate 3,4-dioxygenase beta subunit
LKNVVVRAATQSIVSGKVLDQDGEPMEHANVTILRAGYYRGKRQWNSAGSAQTNDLGEYRIPIGSGSYLVSANFRNPYGRSGFPNGPLPDKPELAYVVTYYPSAIDPAAATNITAGNGEVRGIDIKLRKAPTVRIRGRVIDPGAPANRPAFVTLAPKGGTGSMGGYPTSMMPEGNFEIAGVPPGSYTLTARRSTNDGGMGGSSSIPPIQYGAVQAIEIADKQVDGITLTVTSSKDVQGKFVVEGNTTLDLRSAYVMATSVDGMGMGPQAAARGIEGTGFTLRNVPPGRSTVNVSGGQANCYVKSIRYGGHEIPADGVDLTTGAALEIVVSPEGARLDGKVVNAAGEPLFRGIVSLFATDAQGATAPTPPIAMTDRNGEFRFAMLRPGEYQVYAWEAVDQNSVQTAEFLKPYAARSKAVKLEAKGTATVSLTGIPAGETAASYPFARPPQQGNHVKGSVEGQVLHGITGEPIKRATVRLGGASFARGTAGGAGRGGVVVGAIGGGGATGQTTEADEQGRFVFHDVEPGSYALGAERQGFLVRLYGQRQGMPDEQFIVGEGQHVQDMVLKLVPQGVIAGRVLDEEGSPLRRTTVAIFRRGYSLGKLQFSAVGAPAQTTNDLGEYRFIGLEPGSYVIGARYVSTRTPLRPDQPLPPLPEQPDMEYPATYFPNAPDPGGAKPIALESGTQVTGVDITLQRVPLLRVRGKVVDPKGLPQTFTVLLVAKGGDLHTRVGVLPITRRPDGSFEISGVTPGVYTLAAWVAEGGLTRAAAQTVEVRDKHLDGVTLELAPAHDVTANITVEEKTPINTSGLFATLSSIDNTGNPSFGQNVNNDSKLTFRNLLPVPYTLNVTNLPFNCNCYVKSVRYGGQEIPETGAMVTGGGELEIVLSTRAAIVEGAVVDRQGKPVGGAVLALLPKDGSLEHLKTGVANAEGKYYFPSNPPGEYKLLAWEDVDTALLQQPGFLQQLDASAQSVQLGAGGRETIRLTAIPASGR